jgi:hypothetical protein
MSQTKTLKKLLTYCCCQGAHRDFQFLFSVQVTNLTVQGKHSLEKCTQACLLLSISVTGFLKGLFEILSDQLAWHMIGKNSNFPKIFWGG